MSYCITRVDGMEHIDLLKALNDFEPGFFPPLKSRHFSDGVWWLVQVDNDAPTVVGFAAMVAMTPFPNVAYCKRCWIHPDHRGSGLQGRLLAEREELARQLGMVLLVSETAEINLASRRSFEKAGFAEFEPEQPWAGPGNVYYKKAL